MSVRLYVGNLPEDVNRQELEAVFAPGENIVSLKLITDRKTGKCRGFGFLTVNDQETADSFIAKFNGVAFKENPLRVELAQPKTARPEREGGEGEATAAEAPAGESATPAPAIASRPISSGRPIRKPNRERNDNRREAAPRDRSYVADEATQPDPRWAEALRTIRRQLTKA